MNSYANAAEEDENNQLLCLAAVYILVNIQEVKTFVQPLCIFNTNFGENAFKDHILGTSGLVVFMTYVKHKELIS